MGLRFDNFCKWLAVCAISFLFLSLFCRCTTTKYVPVTEYRDRVINKTDSFLKTDSVYTHDSVSVYIRGDTVFKDKFRLQYKDRYIVKSKSDTLIVRDSIPYRASVIKEKQLSFTDKTLLGLGKLFAVILFIGAFAFVGWIYWRLKLHKQN